ncbi:hypothetical protein, partial [Yersinia pestis]|uniref:hypothetical protein n=1 Tax=Yersinia pestis TaxID=632 RepID=UPI0004A30D77
TPNITLFIGHVERFIESLILFFIFYNNDSDNCGYLPMSSLPILSTKKKYSFRMCSVSWDKSTESPMLKEKKK